MSEKIFLSIGSNIGDRKSYLSFAVRRLAGEQGMEFCRKSSLYLTEPWGKQDQEGFYNAVVEYETTRQPWELLSLCHEIEFEAGRERKVQWGPRTLDIDILWYGGQHIATGELQVPHPFLSERLFVMVPLAELEPKLEIPLRGRLDILLENYRGTEKVEWVCGADDW